MEKSAIEIAVCVGRFYHAYTQGRRFLWTKNANETVRTCFCCSYCLALGAPHVWRLERRNLPTGLLFCLQFIVVFEVRDAVVDNCIG